MGRAQDRQGQPNVEGQWTSQRVRPRAGCGRGARLIQGGCPRHVVSVSTTGLQAVGAAVPGSATLGGCKTRRTRRAYGRRPLEQRSLRRRGGGWRRKRGIRGAMAGTCWPGSADRLLGLLLLLGCIMVHDGHLDYPGIAKSVCCALPGFAWCRACALWVHFVQGFGRPPGGGPWLQSTGVPEEAACENSSMQQC